MGEEKRGEPRIEHAFMARYRAFNPLQQMEPRKTSWLLSPLKDISRGGARFFSESDFTEGATLQMQLLLPTAEQPVVVVARIAWVKPGPMQLREYGVTFTVEDPAQAKAIEASVAHFLKRGP